MKSKFLIFTLLTINLFSQRTLHERWNIELKKYVDEKGLVDYYNWSKESYGIDSYIEALQKNHPKKYWSKNEILSYWINAYNALTIKLILDNYPVNSIRDIDKPWSKKVIYYEFISYSLDQIEHDILRKMGDPRIHFAINCASISCPKLLNSAYLPYKIENQLENVTKNFLNDSTKNIINEDEIIISKIFFWFKKDFGTKSQIQEFIKKYSEKKLNNPKVKYLPYDWGLNGINKV